MADSTQRLALAAEHAARLLDARGAAVLVVTDPALRVEAAFGLALPPVLARSGDPPLEEALNGQLITVHVEPPPTSASGVRALFEPPCTLVLAPVAGPNLTVVAVLLVVLTGPRALSDRDRRDLAHLGATLAREVVGSAPGSAREDIEAELAAVMEQMIDPAWLVDERSRLTAFNTACAQASEAFTGRPLRAGDDSAAPLPPAMRDTWNDCVRRALAGEVASMDLRWPSPDREMHFEITFAPVYREGRVVRALGIQRDRTAHMEIQVQARAQERLFRAVTDNTVDVISIIDAEARVRFVSRASLRLLGLAPEELLGRPIGELMHPDDRRDFERQLAEHQRSPGHVGELMHRLRHSDGTFRPFESRSLSLVDDPVIRGVLVVSRDVTEERRARYVEQMIQAQEDERRRVARELHDVTGQTLTGLLVGLRTLEDLPIGEAGRAQVANLRRLTSGAVDDVGRLARGLHPAVLDDHGLGAALERMASLLGGRGPRLDVQLVGFGGGARLPAALETSLFRVAQEALTNILKHSGARTVSLVVDWQPHEVRLVVEDDGRGFEVEKVTSTSVGLGLRSITERVALLRGQVEIESTPEAGTALFVRVPLPSV